MSSSEPVSPEACRGGQEKRIVSGCHPPADGLFVVISVFMNTVNKQSAKKRIKKLKEVINRHRYLYHVLDKQEISDAALDSLKHELKQLEDKYPDLRTSDSPTQRVSGEPLDAFEKVEHSTPMLSVEDVFNGEELRSWEDYLKRLTDETITYFCEVKVDGLALALTYRNGVLERAATRGNGRIGEDVTENAKTIESIPLRLSFHTNISDRTLQKKAVKHIQDGVFEVRGEVYIPKKAFERFNAQQEKAGKEPYANPRNLAAGSVRQLDPQLAASRPLSFLAYDIVTDIEAETHEAEHEILPALGFPTDPTAKRCANIQCVVDYWQKIAEQRQDIPYQIDGVIVSVNSNAVLTALGVAGKSPRGMRAFKFSPKQATTVVKDIKVHVGRTGAVTPVATLDPIQIGGVTVSRATLHNPDEIERLDVRVGDTVVVERAGDVIPKVVEVLKDLRPKDAKKFTMPKTCPGCGDKIVKKPGETIWYCPNPECGPRKQAYLRHFVSRSAFDIEGLGGKIIERFMDEGLISDVADIFKLKQGDIAQLEGFGEKSAENIVQEVEDSKTIPLARFISALNIRYVGEETAIELAHAFGGIETLQKATIQELQDVEGVGKKVAESIHEWFSDKRHQKRIRELLKAGVSIQAPERRGIKLAGKTFVLTGSLETLTRQQAEKAIRQQGGDVASSVSQNTDYVVAGESPGSKYEQAKEQDITIIGEKELLAMLDG